MLFSPQLNPKLAKCDEVWSIGKEVKYRLVFFFFFHYHLFLFEVAIGPAGSRAMVRVS